MTAFAAHLSLFISAVLSATLVPGSSELVFAGLIILYPDLTLSLYLTATLGNTLGVLVNWYLGYWLSRFADKRWFPVSAERLTQASSRLHRYGSWLLLLSWIPILGDALTVAAGVIRIGLVRFLVLVAAGKAVRYAAVLAGVKLYGVVTLT